MPGHRPDAVSRATSLGRRRLAALGLCIGLAVSVPARSGTTIQVPTREGVSTSLFWEPAPALAGPPQATLLLFPGAGGGFGRVDAAIGQAGSRNFLVRSVGLFIAQGFNVAIFGRPTDRAELDYADRIHPDHLADVQKVLDHVTRQLSPAPVWLVGTSRGSISATAAAIALRADPRVAGLVLSSSVTSRKRTGAVPAQDLAAVRVPVLVVHHRHDACPICAPHEADGILRGLTNASTKKLMWMDGGGPVEGDACGAMHWHGYVGIERTVVDAITRWIQAPVN